MRSARLLPWLALAAAAGCAAQPGPAPVGPSAYAEPPSRIDGRYRGIARLTRADIARGCPRSGPRTITVEGQSFTVQYRGERVSYSLAAVVDPSGSIHGSDGRGNVEGRISGRHMDLNVSSPYCEVRYALDRTP